MLCRYCKNEKVCHKLFQLNPEAYFMLGKAKVFLRFTRKVNNITADVIT